MAKDTRQIVIPGIDHPLSEAQAKQIIAGDPLYATYVLMQLSLHIAQLKEGPGAGPHAPSSATPVYQKPTTPAAKKRRSKRGAKPGHPGHHRPRPERIDRQEEHRLERCPDCGGPVSPVSGPSGQRTRIIEDIPEQVQTEAVEHVIHRAWCACCKKSVEPKVLDALPGATLGHRLLVMVVWLRYGIGVSISQLQEVYNQHLQVKISEGGIVKMSRRLTGILQPWYEQIGAAVRTAGVVNGDETGWRVNGETHWLWCFTTPDATYYHIDRSRGSPVVREFLKETFAGTLVSDFWGAYEFVAEEQRQVCLAHLLRELRDLNEKKLNVDWFNFHDELRDVLKAAIRLSRRSDREAPDYDRKRQQLQLRVHDLVSDKWTDPDAARLAKRLAKYHVSLFTFLYDENVPFDNNRAEREIRPAVVIRKRSQGNQSDDGAEIQAVMMSVFRTLRLRGHDPLPTLQAALRTYVETGKLPPLPEKIAAAG